MYGLIKKALFNAPPELAHELALESLRLGHTFGATSLACKAVSLPVRVMGLDFPNPVGLSAGMDKNGDYIDALGALGFGFIEIGTITPRPQPGNPRPRVFRLPQAEAMINRLGFNNKGVDHLVARASKRRYKGILGINIGKNADTPNDRANDDFLYCFERVYPWADYIAVNVSSPNTRGLRDLQNAGALDGLLGALCRRRAELAATTGRRVPIAVKVSPELDDRAIKAVAEVVIHHQVDGVIATNTTLDRDAVSGLPFGQEQGGLSGAPLRAKADKVLQRFRGSLPATVALIGVGGITQGAHAEHKMRLGADLVQFYTGFVYHGPALIADCLHAVSATGIRS